MNDSIKEFITGWIVPIISAVIIAVLINKFLFFMALIPSTSMYPTLKNGDRIFVTKVYSTENLKRGDIVLFRSDELDNILVKRLIGLPGDTVEVKENNDVYVNGQKLDEPYVKQPGGDKKGYGTYKVPEGCFFFLGDNRVDSYDSRFWNVKYIPKNAIIGKAHMILFPFNRFGMLK